MSLALDALHCSNYGTPERVVHRYLCRQVCYSEERSNPEL